MVKLPRWLLWTMILCSAVPPLAVAGWWWVTWPERTARTLIDHIAADRIDETIAMIGGLSFPRFPDCDWSKVHAAARGPIDLALGQETFELSGAVEHPGNRKTVLDVQFVVKRGAITAAKTNVTVIDGMGRTVSRIESELTRKTSSSKRPK